MPEPVFQEERPDRESFRETARTSTEVRMKSGGGEEKITGRPVVLDTGLPAWRVTAGVLFSPVIYINEETMKKVSSKLNYL